MSVKAETSNFSTNSIDLRSLALAYWAQDRPRSAVETAWAAFDLESSDRAVKQLLVDLLHCFPSELASERRAAFLGLLTDRQVEPDLLSRAGWHLVLRNHALAGDALEDAAFESLAVAFGSDELAIALLREAPVYSPVAERLLTRLRRWLLLSGEWGRHSDLVSALTVQASLNGGAWPFDETERARLGNGDSGLVAAYLPRRSLTGAIEAGAADAVTRAVTAQYEGWPWPVWTRITLAEPRRLPDVVRKMDPHAVQDLPVDANMLIAGCGTGRQAANVASKYPEATVTAIDVSEPSLDYARRSISRACSSESSTFMTWRSWASGSTPSTALACCTICPIPSAAWARSWLCFGLAVSCTSWSTVGSPGSGLPVRGLLSATWRSSQ
jgi:hypothetical protein